MKLALISDIHANEEALTAVLCDAEERSVDRILCLGDVVGYGCAPKACVDLVARNCQLALMGNHDNVAINKSEADNFNAAARESSRWTQDQLGDEEVAIISQYKMRHREFGIEVVHASPNEPDNWKYVLKSEDADEAFGSFEGQVCFIGHTHLPMIFSKFEDNAPRQTVGHSFQPNEEARYLVNIGSVGQPRDNDARACYVIYDTNEIEVNYHRVAYDIEKAQKRMAEFSLPTALIERLAVGR